MRLVAVIAAGVFLAVLSGCQVPGSRRLLYVDSYHPGDATSDALLGGIYEVVADSKARLDVSFLDTKRFPQAEAIGARVDEVLSFIRENRPEVILVSGDSAVQRLVVEHLQAGPVPCVFCTADWTPDANGLSTEYVTGIRENPPVREAATTLQAYYPDMQKVVVLSGVAAGAQGDSERLEAIFSELGMEVTFVSVQTYPEWETQFAKANSDADLLFLPTNRGIEGWDQAEARAFVQERIEIPVFTCDASMMKYAVFGLTPSRREQGRWAAKTALRLLQGTPPSKIAIAQIPETTAYLNESLAGRIGFEPQEQLLERCRRCE